MCVYNILIIITYLLHTYKNCPKNMATVYQKIAFQNYYCVVKIIFFHTELPRASLQFFKLPIKKKRKP